MRSRIILPFLLVSLLGWVDVLLAQTSTTLSGYVTDAATGSPMPFANVYLNNSTHGTNSDEKGHFVLTNVPPGTVDVVASFVGYQTGRQTVRLNEAKFQTLNFRLTPSDQILASVTVKANRNEKKWQQQLRQFKQQLFGEPFGSQCKLINSDGLHFIEENGHLKATASEPLAIENQALGYRLWYDLSYFDGESKQVHYGGSTRFEEINATNEQQTARVRHNRMRAYLGSTRHLMASLIAGNYEQEGFRVYVEDSTVSTPVLSDSVTLQRAIGYQLRTLTLPDLIQPGQLSFERKLVSTRPLVVFYTKAKSSYSPYADARYAYTRIELPNGPMELLTNGWITLPNGVQMQGSLADDRLSTLLPADWKPTPLDSPTVPDLAPVNAQPLTQKITLYSSEKAYIHTDRSQYVAGDTLWFNAYLVDGTEHTPTVISKTLYVNLLDSTGQLTASRILHVDSTGHAPGDITLTDSLQAGTYQLLAYTNWMRNADHAFLFRKRIRIDSKTAHTSEEDKVILPAGISLQVFPEGGQLVVGLPARVAFQARDSQGHGLSVTGVLTNERGDTLSDFRSLHRGMGTFSFTPQAGHHYRAMASSADGQQTTVRLPDALPTGYQLAVDNLTTPHSVRVLIHSSQGQPGQLTLFAHLRGQVCYQAQVDANKAEMLLAIPYDSIRQDGILHLTLFDANNQPVAERLVFIDRHRQLGIHIQTDKATYQPRQPVSLTISATNPSGKPISTRLSLSVTDSQQALEMEPGAATLRSYLLLTSDLRGHVEEPEFYFDSTQAHVRQYLDYVMLTHGWRRFNWQTILSDSTIHPGYEAETGLSLRGQVRYGDDNKLAREASLTGMFKTNQSLAPMDITTDKEGRFAMDNLLFSDTATVIIRHRTNRPIKLQLTPLTVPDFMKLPSLSTSSNSVADRQAVINKALETQLWTKRLQQNGGTMLQAVTVKANRLDASRKDYRRQRYGVPDITVDIDDIMASGKASARELIGYLPLTQRVVKPIFMIDGMQVLATGIDIMSAYDVEAIDLVVGGVSGDGDGIINFLTKHGPGPGKRINQVMGKVVGYAVSREFYSPQYANEFMATKPDYRATLYWNPSVQTDANGQATVTFYNSDETTTVRIIAEGITADGKPGYSKSSYSVKK